MPSVAKPRSASSITITAFLPPSSREMRLLRRAPRVATSVPVSVDPVNEMSGTCGCSTMASPTSEPVPITRLTTPGGNPASSSTSINRMPIRGVKLAGLNTAVFPAMRAGIIFQEGIASGKFQGVMMPQTPIGLRTDMLNLLRISDGVV